MDRDAWQATDHGGLKKSDTTEKQTLSLSLSLSLVAEHGLSGTGASIVEVLGL